MLTLPTRQVVRRRIVCLGNRLKEEDAAGMLVHDLLVGSPLPPGTEVVDGGTAGLNLLCFLEGAMLVIFVDAVQGFQPQGGVVALDPLRQIAETGYDHDDTLGYMLAVAPRVLAQPLPPLLLVGLEGPPTPAHCRLAANYCLTLPPPGLPVANQGETW